jgi:hypothetical protein
MFGAGRLHICIDEVMSALVLLMDKAPTWYGFVTKHTKSLECKSVLTQNNLVKHVLKVLSKNPTFNG